MDDACRARHAGAVRLVLCLAALALAVPVVALADHAVNPPYGSCVADGPDRQVAEALGDRYGGVFADRGRWVFPLPPGASEQAARGAAVRCGPDVLAHSDFPSARFTFEEIRASRQRVEAVLGDLWAQAVWGLGIGVSERAFALQVSILPETTADQEREVRRRVELAAGSVPYEVERAGQPVAGGATPGSAGPPADAAPAERQIAAGAADLVLADGGLVSWIAVAPNGVSARRLVDRGGKLLRVPASARIASFGRDTRGRLTLISVQRGAEDGRLRSRVVISARRPGARRGRVLLRAASTSRGFIASLVGGDLLLGGSAKFDDPAGRGRGLFRRPHGAARLTRLTRDVPSSLSVSGRWVAYVTHRNDDLDDRSRIRLLDLRSRRVRTLAAAEALHADRYDRSGPFEVRSPAVEGRFAYWVTRIADDSPYGMTTTVTRVDLTRPGAAPQTFSPALPVRSLAVDGGRLVYADDLDRGVHEVLSPAWRVVGR